MSELNGHQRMFIILTVAKPRSSTKGFSALVIELVEFGFMMRIERRGCEICVIVNATD